MVRHGAIKVNRTSGSIEVGRRMHESEALMRWVELARCVELIKQSCNHAMQ